MLKLTMLNPTCLVLCFKFFILSSISALIFFFSSTALSLILFFSTIVEGIDVASYNYLIRII